MVEDLPVQDQANSFASKINQIILEAKSDASKIAEEMGKLAKEFGMSRLARETGLSRESLYKSLSGTRSPDFATILKILSAFNLDLVVRKKLTRSEDAR